MSRREMQSPSLLEKGLEEFYFYDFFLYIPDVFLRFPVDSIENWKSQTECVYVCEFAIIQFSPRYKKGKSFIKIQLHQQDCYIHTQANRGGPQNRQQINWKRTSLFTHTPLSNQTISCQIECKNLIKPSLWLFCNIILLNIHNIHIWLPHIWISLQICLAYYCMHNLFFDLLNGH